MPDRDQSCFILCIFSSFLLNNAPFLFSQLPRFSRWINFCALYTSLCWRNWNYESYTRVSAGRILFRARICIRYLDMGICEVQTACLTLVPSIQQATKKSRRASWRPSLLVMRVASKRLCHWNCGPNPQKAGHLGCLNNVEHEKDRWTKWIYAC